MIASTARAWSVSAHRIPGGFRSNPMKALTPDILRRILALGIAGFAGLLAAGCAMPSKEEWAQINQRGLIPVLIDSKQTEVASGSSGAARPSSQDAVRVQAVTTPLVVRTHYADAVPGRPGFVYTPHTSPRRIVDVRGFHAGEEVRCPYTNHPFAVPDFNAVAASTRPAPVTTPGPVTDVVSNASSAALIDESLTRLEPSANPAPSTPPVESITPPASVSDAARAAIPYGIRVPGRPGLVYSPHDAKKQFVDVKDMTPGVVVQCPYTNKLFRVPEAMAGEAAPAPAPAPSPPAAPAESNPAPEKPADAPAAPDSGAASDPATGAGGQP
jgi:hypothetical protein